ncbi:DUF2798 domain-containing protein [Cupriavidus sp. WKF15]|uniref:DUF2798 domain-containing protein n=1 Tax=Cupriavidus sp. WKF15 TaxID=3032282 RepID=UPI0023E2177A|nr:DUF2798 domain-containing protein [Cupriavidus sp. WKF15]WER50876.1 DUF2798 domain-containing protein [Cupriavidus sp. WKF15]
MSRVPKRYGHLFYGVIQSCLTTGITACIASFSSFETGNFLMHWARLWLLSWAAMLPVVVFAAPIIRRMTDRITGNV